MREQIEQLLIQLARFSTQSPAIQIIVGFLMAEPHRVRVVHQLRRDANLSMSISAHRRIEVPLAPWQGFVRGVPVPDPITWIQASRSYGQEPIAIRVSTDDRTLLELVTPMIAPDQDRAERAGWETRIGNVRQELDRALDLYNEVRHIMEIDHDRADELGQFLSMAESQMQAMGRELKILRGRLEKSDEL